MVTRNFNGLEGYTPYPVEGGPTSSILLPSAIVNAIAHDARTPKITEGATRQLLVWGGKPLPEIPRNCDASMPAACAFATALLAGVPPPELLPARFSADLLAGILRECIHRDPHCGWDDVFLYVSDPAWDTERQMFLSFQIVPVMKQPSAQRWLTQFLAQVRGLPHDVDDLSKAACKHWTMALAKLDDAKEHQAVGSVPVALPHVVQVFDPLAREQAVTHLAELPRERRSTGARILEQARAEGGMRPVPDALSGVTKLEDKKREFENLVAPIERLQTDLLLASKMDPRDFRVAPILLLGSPGIGKTYLATQLAEVLGVPSDKISAGGAQGGFQLTGSHSAWTAAKPGAIVTMLAKSPTATPVMVVDEVDKMAGDARYPFLPVLLDLLDAGTACEFKDDYFEMTMDASHIIYVLTANSLQNVPPALVSRVEVFTVAPPAPAQRLRIIEQTVAALVQKTKMPIRLAPGVAERLAERTSMDLRQVNRMVTTAFATAIYHGSDVAQMTFADGADNQHTAFNLAAWAPSSSIQ